jgi:hypothetical protein
MFEAAIESTQCLVNQAAQLSEVLLSFLILLSQWEEDNKEDSLQYHLKEARYAFEIYYKLLCKVNDPEV